MVKINAKNWLGEIPSKDKIEALGRGRPSWLKDQAGLWELKKDETLEGELEINGFSNLRVIYLGQFVGAGKGSLTKVIINNCPNVEHIDLYNNEINELDVSNLAKLKILVISDNNLGKIKVADCENLWSIEAKGNKDTKIEGLEDLKKLSNIRFSSAFVPSQELKNWKIVIGPNGLNDILSSGGNINELKLKEYNEAINRPTQEQLNKAVADEKDKYKNFIDPENLEAKAREKGMVSAEEFNKRPDITIDKYNELLKNQKPVGFPDDWEKQLKELTELRKRPTQEDYDKLKVLKDTTVANYNKLVLDKNTLQQQLITTQAELAKVRTDLAKWNSKFLNQTPEQVEAEINRLKQSATTLTPDQRQKIADYDRLKTEKETLGRRREAVLRHLRNYITEEQYDKFIQINNKVN